MGADWWRLGWDVLWGVLTIATATGVALLARIKASGTRIEAVERHLTSEIHGMGDRVTRLEEQVKVLPSADDVARIAVSVEGLRSDVRSLGGSLGQRIEDVKELIDRTDRSVRSVQEYLLDVKK